MFLGKGRENEVGLRYGKEITVGLRAFAAPQAPGTYGNLGLLNLVPRALGIEFGVDKTGQSLFLVGLEHVHPRNQENRANSHGGEQTDNQPLLPLQPAQKHSHDGNGDVGKRGAKIWLGQDHQHGNADNRSRLHEIAPGELPLAHVGKILGDSEDEDKLDPLRRLEVVPAGHVDPALRPQVPLSEEKHSHQGGHTGDVEPVDLIEQRLIVDQADQKHGANAGQHPVDLFDVGSGELGVHGGAVDFHYAQAADHEHEAQQDPVEIAV